MPNAFNNVTVTTDPLVVFCTRSGNQQAAAENDVEAAASDAQDRDGAVALSIYNSGGTDAEVKCQDCHPDVTRWKGGAALPVQWMPLPAGKSITLRANRGDKSPNNQIDKVTVRCASGSTTIGGGVTEWA